MNSKWQLLYKKVLSKPTVNKCEHPIKVREVYVPSDERKTVMTICEQCGSWVWNDLSTFRA